MGGFGATQRADATGQVLLSRRAAHNEHPDPTVNDSGAGGARAGVGLGASTLSVTAGSRHLLREITLQVQPGSWLAVVGPNGAGKSTLLRCLAGLHPHTGQVHLGATQTATSNPAHGPDVGAAVCTGTAAGAEANTRTRTSARTGIRAAARAALALVRATADSRTSSLSLRQRARLVAYVPQRPTLTSTLSVADFVLLGRAPHFAVAGWARGCDQDAVAQVLQELDLSALSTRRLGSLSGGEQQRVVLAKALAQQGQVLILDEPTSALDIGHAQQCLELLDRLRAQRGLTVVTALHDLNQAAHYATDVALLDRGHLLAHGTPTQVLTTARLSGVYHASLEVNPHHNRPLITALR